MSYQPVGHVRALSGVSDDTVVGSPATVRSQPAILEEHAHQGGSEKHQVAHQYAELTTPTSHYDFPLREVNDSRATQYDHNANVSRLSSTSTKEASPHVRKISSQESNNATDAGIASARWLSRSESWAPEVLSLVLAVLSMVAMIAILAHFNGRALPLWPSTFVTLNAVVAVLVTMTAAFVGIPLSNGLSQIKWIRVQAPGGAPLADMDMFDSASRGAMGSFGMLVKGRGG